MQRCAGAIVCAVIAATFALAESPVAQADDASFVSAAAALDGKHGPVNLISAGRSACYFLLRNRDPGQITERIARTLLIDMDQSRSFLLLAVNEYCPQYREQVGA